MNKTELIERLADQTDSSKEKVQVYVEAFAEVVAAALRDGDEVQIPGFGKFYVQEREAREGMNPQTRKKMLIPASKVPKFSAGRRLKQSV